MTHSDAQGGALSTPLWPASAADNYPLRGGKATLFEGGVRGTSFMGGGLVPPAARGSTFDGLMHAVDLFATMVARGGVAAKAVDGIDHWNALTTPSAPSLRSHLPINLIHNGSDFSCVVFAAGSLKLIVGRANTVPAPAINGWFRHGLFPPAEPPPAQMAYPLLFNLSADPTEHHPLPLHEPAHAALVAEGHALLATYLVGADPLQLGFREPQPNRPQIPRCLPVLHGGAWAPFLREETEAEAEAEAEALAEKGPRKEDAALAAGLSARDQSLS